MRKFLDYYLPTSLKLLEAYAEMDAQGIEGENISESKRRIEQAMGTWSLPLRTSWTSCSSPTPWTFRQTST